MTGLWGWFVGQVWPNIVASLIWAVPGALAHLHTRRRLGQLHAKHDALHTQLTEAIDDARDPHQ